MKTKTLTLILTLFACILPARAEEKPISYVLTKVRLLAAPGSEAELKGGRITGSLEGPTTAPVELAKVTEAPAAGQWLEVKIPRPVPYRYIKFESGAGTAVRLAEIRFLSATGELPGEPFGTNVPKEQADTAHPKAFDDDPATCFIFPDDNSYAGLDLGGKSQAPRPRFSVSEGGYAEPQEVKIDIWPAGATIRYTMDDSIPDKRSPVYEKPITVSKNVTIAAKSFQDGLCESDVSVASYRIGPDAVNVPLVTTYHIGNSLTDTVNGFLSTISASAGKNHYYIRKTIPGCGIEWNWKLNEKGFASPEGWMNNYQRVFAEKKIDHLFLQPFPNPPGIDGDAEFGGNFIQLAREHNPDVQPWLYAQWPSQNWKGDAHCQGAGWMKPEWYPPNREPADWEEAMANKMLYYREVFKRWDELPGNKRLKMVPGGPALVRLKKAIEAGEVPGMTEFFPEIFADGIHLTRQGRYLVALVFYGCLFEESPEWKVTRAHSGLTAAQAIVFQRIAWEAVQAEPLSGVKALPNVLILGDSISMGYTDPVRELLKGKANVYRPLREDGFRTANCGNTKMGLAALDTWLAQHGGKWDVIHFNWGLWDINRRTPQNQDNLGVPDRVNGGISFTEAEYAANLEKIVQRLEKTGAKLIWASTSYVPEGCNARQMGDELIYNKAAAEVMKKHGIPINDICTRTHAMPPEKRPAPSDVHYTAEGYREIAEPTAKIIEEFLP